MLDKIIEELKHHAPFTVFGAVTGVILMIFFQKLPHEVSRNLFYILHPFHVVLSALVTASIYEIHRCPATKSKCNIWMLLAVGYVGSIGVATLSDSLIPYLGEILLRMPRAEPHIGFIERWWLINPLALIGVAIAYFKPRTKFPHAGHVLISTWASLLHIAMAAGGGLNWLSYVTIFAFLFIAVWLPCCISDIIFPLLFVRKQHPQSTS